MPLPLDGSPPADDADRRWDGTSVHAWTGTLRRLPVGQGRPTVFPELFAVDEPSVQMEADGVGHQAAVTGEHPALVAPLDQAGQIIAVE